MVSRYDVVWSNTDEAGDFVSYADYAALAERCERLEAALRELADAFDCRMTDWENADFHEEYRNAIALLSGSNGGKE